MTAPAPARVQPLNEIFTRGVSAMWAATYNVDLALFNEFLLGRLSDPPVNVVVLADHRRLAVSLARIPPERAAALSSVNRRWLLRSVKPGGQAFHPKSYLAVSAAKTTLLVGSGNLSAPGLDSGKEVFTTFRSGTPDGDAALATWNDWTRRLVEHTADVALAERYADLQRRLPASAPAAVSRGPLLHNLDGPIAGQLAAAVRAETDAPVDDLLLTAPFYDDDAAAAAELLTTLAPRRAHVYVTSTTSVNGPRLAQRLADSGADVRVFAYVPDEFVHAKLVGVTAGDDGWLLSGSANLSRAALTSRAALAGGHGNVELAVLARLSADAVRAAFLPPGAVAAEQDPQALAPLTFRTDADPAPPPVRLLTAAAAADGRIEVEADRPIDPVWLLDDLAGHHPLVPGEGRRAATASAASGRLVRLCAADKEPLSNHVVVDDPAALRAALVGSGRDRSDRPPELAGDDTGGPLGQGLLLLHRQLVMDVSETASSAGGGGVGAGDADQQDDDDLWARLEREELARDGRAHAYSRLWRPDSAGDAIIELLEVLRDRAPAQGRAPGAPVVSLLAVLLARRRAEEEAAAGAEPPGDVDAPRRRWKASTRTRIRALNVLRRWAAAQHDPRLTWVDPLAPAGNFAAVTGFLADLRLRRAADPGSIELNEQDLDNVWSWWLRPMAGSGQGDGWLDTLAPDERGALHEALPGWLPEAAAALTWLLIRPGTNLRARTVDAQPVLVAARAHGLLAPTDVTAAFLGAVTGSPVSQGEVAGGLVSAAEFVDDELWCARTAAELGLFSLRLDAPPGSAVIQVRLSVRGMADPLLDPRVPRLLAAARQYRRATGIAVFEVDEGWRLAFVDGEPVTYLPSARGADMLQSNGALDSDSVTALASEGLALAELFPASAHVA